LACTPYRNAAEISRHPRNLTSTVRRQDTTRKEARERRKARKEEELLQKHEEVKRLKALKMKELRRKLERIGKEGGLQDVDKHQGIIEPRAMFSIAPLRIIIAALQDLDLEGDWDPDAHDRQMAGIYAQDDDGEFYDEEKPMWDDDINVDDIVPPVASSSNRKRLQEYMDSLLELEFNDVVSASSSRDCFLHISHHLLVRSLESPRDLNTLKAHPSRLV